MCRLPSCLFAAAHRQVTIFIVNYQFNTTAASSRNEQLMLIELGPMNRIVEIVVMLEDND